MSLITGYKINRQDSIIVLSCLLYMITVIYLVKLS